MSKLLPGQKMTKCDSCYGSSIVHVVSIDQKVSSDSRGLRSRLNKQASCPVFSTSDLHHSSSENWRNASVVYGNQPQTYEYAECTRAACSHRFCTKCLASPHEGQPCAIRPLGSSPTSDDDQANRQQDIRKSRRNQYRLRRLRFN